MLLLPALRGASAEVSPAKAKPEPNRIVFVHAAVVPMDEERVLSDQTVIVADGTIVEIGSSAEIAIPDGAQVVDASGRYLLPAFCDMHVHLLGEAWNMMLPPEEQIAKENMPFSLASASSPVSS